jgi:hypothetical protein
VILIVVKSSTKYFLAWQSWKGNQLLRLLGNTEHFCIVYVNIIKERTYCCLLMSNMATRTHHVVTFCEHCLVLLSCQEIQNLNTFIIGADLSTTVSVHGLQKWYHPCVTSSKQQSMKMFGESGGLTSRMISPETGRQKSKLLPVLRAYGHSSCGRLLVVFVMSRMEILAKRPATWAESFRDFPHSV